MALRRAAVMTAAAGGGGLVELSSLSGPVSVKLTGAAHAQHACMLDEY